VNQPTVKRGRLQLIIIALVFIGPLALATWMYRTGAFTPAVTSNNGVLIIPVVNIVDSPLTDIAGGKWTLVYSNDGVCEEICREALHRLRQTRLMTGSEMDRIVRAFLHGDSSPDKVLIQGEHPGLQTIKNRALGNLLEENRPRNALPGGIYLLDPLANLVMYFPPDLEPRDMVGDIKHLLKLSRIG